MRGGIFHINGSSTWARNTANISTGIYNLVIGSQFGYDSKAKFGFDDVTLGWQAPGGPSLRNQTIGGFAAKDSYLGLFGLTPRPTNSTSFETPIPSYIQNLAASSSIPSLLGVIRRATNTVSSQIAGTSSFIDITGLDGFLGSLVLGGHDRSKFLANNMTWSFSSQDISDLTVQINSISTSFGAGKTQVQLLSEFVLACLDSLLSAVYLTSRSSLHLVRESL